MGREREAGKDREIGREKQGDRNRERHREIQQDESQSLLQTILEVTSHHFFCILFVRNNYDAQPTLKGRGLFKAMNDHYVKS